VTGSDPSGSEQPPVDYPADAGLPPPVAPSPHYPPQPGNPLPPGYPPPGYYASPGCGFDPYRPMRPLGTNGKAIASLVCSALALACCGLTAIPGVILGVMGMRETKRTGQEGWGIALAGTIIGAVFIAGMAVYLLLYVGLIASGWQWT
jgi:hypothetical protein